MKWNCQDTQVHNLHEHLNKSAKTDWFKLGVVAALVFFGTLSANVIRILGPNWLPAAIAIVSVFLYNRVMEEQIQFQHSGGINAKNDVG
jgi:hypothetical protein